MTRSKQLLHTSLGLFLTGVASLGLAFLMFLRASDTGSLQQYFILIIFVFFGFNRFIRVIRVLRK